MSEFLMIYFMLLIVYPLQAWMLFDVLPLVFITWLVLGLLIILIMVKKGKNQYTIPVIALYFMPGVAACGAAALIPWPITFLSYWLGEECFSGLYLIASLLMNLILVYVIAYVYGKVKAMTRKDKLV